MDDRDQLPDGEYTAVVDRFEDDLVVLEVSTADDLRQLVVDRTELPDDGRHADAVFTVTVESASLVDAVYDEEETTARKESAQSRFDRMSRRLGSDDDSGE
ncbi:DUF3006 domain-containing protein [Halobaculum limi]|uniref:DUF3006 domain-containing protein n=1 Tax=Halobaculum limi TaxID=3031916 RepID=UPI0024067BDF|nr:DUF3006 domain-containing protein [Halobaculum sp. YSMS11]